MNELSRHLKVKDKEKNTKNINKFIDNELNIIKVAALKMKEKTNILKLKYLYES